MPAPSSFCCGFCRTTRRPSARSTTRSSSPPALPATATASSARLKRLDFGNQTRLYDAVHASLDELEKVEGRKVILLFTDGADFGSKLSSGKALERARDAEVMIYGIGLETEFFNGQMVVRSKPDSILNRFASGNRRRVFRFEEGCRPQLLVHAHRAGAAQPVPAGLQPGRARRQGPPPGSAREAPRPERRGAAAATPRPPKARFPDV